MRTVNHIKRTVKMGETGHKNVMDFTGLLRCMISAEVTHGACGFGYQGGEWLAARHFWTLDMRCGGGPMDGML